MGEPVRITVVDDDADIREALRETLESEGYQVDLVPNGLKLVRALKLHRPKLILMDIMMSWVSGLDLCRALKANAEFSTIPVVFISARTSPAEVREGLGCGAVDYFTKPFDLPRLLERIAALTHA